MQNVARPIHIAVQLEKARLAIQSFGATHVVEVTATSARFAGIRFGAKNHTATGILLGFLDQPFPEPAMGQCQHASDNFLSNFTLLGSPAHGSRLERRKNHHLVILTQVLGSLLVQIVNLMLPSFPQAPQAPNEIAPGTVTNGMGILQRLNFRDFIVDAINMLRSIGSNLNRMTVWGIPGHKGTHTRVQCNTAVHAVHLAIVNRQLVGKTQIIFTRISTHEFGIVLHNFWKSFSCRHREDAIGTK